MWFSSNTPDHELEAARDEVAADRALLLDVRERKEWDEKRFSSAKLVPTTTIRDLPPDAREIPGVAKSKRVYVHCAKGARAKQVSQRMVELGYDAVPLICSFEHLAELGFK
jgi:rhodanese-related sulfurtransferase